MFVDFRKIDRMDDFGFIYTVSIYGIVVLAYSNLVSRDSRIYWQMTKISSVILVSNDTI